MMKKISAELANTSVFDTEGSKYRLGDSWLKKPVVLVFVRHFG
jgi:hypothetical protein